MKIVDANNACPFAWHKRALQLHEDVRVYICLSVRQGDFGNQLSDSWVCAGVWPRWLSHQQCSSSRWMSHNLPPWGEFSFQRIFASLQWISASPSIQKWSQAEFKINVLWEFIHKIMFSVCKREEKKTIVLTWETAANYSWGWMHLNVWCMSKRSC